jgi:hypothetical protein
MKTTATTEAVSSPPEENGIGTQNGVETPPAPDKNRGRTGKMTCKLMKQAENHENHPRRSWALNHMGNVSHRQ